MVTYIFYLVLILFVHKPKCKITYLWLYIGYLQQLFDVVTSWLLQHLFKSKDMLIGETVVGFCCLLKEPG